MPLLKLGRCSGARAIRNHSRTSRHTYGRALAGSTQRNAWETGEAQAFLSTNKGAAKGLLYGIGGRAGGLREALRYRAGSGLARRPAWGERERGLSTPTTWVKEITEKENAEPKIVGMSALTPGVAGVRGLHGSQDFMPLAIAAEAESNRLKKEISSGVISSPLAILRAVDAISNVVCSVIDAADFLRNAHYDERFRLAAEDAFNHLARHIQELNSDDALYKALCGVISNESAMAEFTEEQRRVAKMHVAEYERGGIHLTGKDREEMLELEQEAFQLARQYELNIVSQRGRYQVPRQDLTGIPGHVLSSVKQPAGQLPEYFTLTTDQSLVSDVLKSAKVGRLRQAVYIAGNTIAEENVKVLEKLIEVRDKLARMVGFKSHAHRVTSDKMARTPEQVAKFLHALEKGTKKKALEEMNTLRFAKMEAEGDGTLYSWDLPYYMGVVKSKECSLLGKPLTEYLTLGNALEGLRLVCKGNFGITMEEVEMPPSENWAADAPGTVEPGGGVLKLKLSHEKEGELGTVYLDLLRREGKFGHAAHFTVRCGCIVRNGEPPDTKTSPEMESGNDAGQYQLPIVVLVCNFALPEPPYDPNVRRLLQDVNKKKGRLLTHSEMETLFHEFGHALHSLLSRTEFQHVSGTRVPVDFGEIPSHFMEHFVWYRPLLKMFAKHFSADVPPTEEMLDRLLASRTLFAATELRTQLTYSLVDLRLFGPQELGKPISASAVANDLRNKVMGYKDDPESPWISRFGHFIGYGSGYYSYLYARMYSSTIWHRLFNRSQTGFSPKSGQKLWEELLRHGGARAPHKMLTAVIREAGEEGEEGIRIGIESLLRDLDVTPLKK